MPTFELSGKPWSEHRPRVMVALAVVVPAALAVGLLTLTGDGEAGGQDLGPTVAVGSRDLATTLEATGTLERSSEHTVAYAGALVADGSSPEPGGSDPSRSGDGGDGDDGDGVTPVAYTSGTGGTSSTSSTTSTFLPTSSSSPSSSSTSTTMCPSTPGSSSTSSTAPGSPCPSSTTSSTTSSTSTSTTSTTRPPSTSTPTSSAPGGNGGRDGAPGGGDGAGPSGPGGGSGDELADGGPGRSGDGPLSGSPTGTGSPSGSDDGEDQDDGEDASATLTGVLDVGTTAGRGTVLYTADDEPVVSLIGDLPAWRALEEGIDDGADVRQLEENLAALGYGAGLDVDEAFTSETAAAIEDWETDLGRSDPDGTVEIGDVVFLRAAGDVLGHDAEVGDVLQPGSPVLTIGAEQRIVVAGVDADSVGGWTSGTTVELEWADGSTSTGTVFGTGRDVTDGQVDLVVAVGADTPSGDEGEASAGDEDGDGAAAAERRTGAEASVTVEDARRDGVLAVPVAAIVEHDGQPAVRVARDGRPDEVVDVETGLVAGGWVEVTAGLGGGEEVRLPG